jgi:hypothetical protein
VECFEGGLLCLFPVPGRGFVREFQEQFGDSRVVLDEISVVACESKEFADLRLGGGCWPGGDFVDLLVIHLNRVARDRDAKELDAALFESAFLWFEEEMVFFEFGEDLRD